MLVEGPLAPVYKISFLSIFYSGPLYKITEPKYGISRPDFNVLLCLSQIGDMNGTELIRATGQPRASISRATLKLCKRKLISARKTGGDDRQKILSLRKKGRVLLSEMMPMFIERCETMFSVLSGSEQQQLDRLLLKLATREDGWIREY
jgi:DNA-binding MarR family transcriptional regulator